MWLTVCENHINDVSKSCHPYHKQFVAFHCQPFGMFNQNDHIQQDLHSSKSRGGLKCSSSHVPGQQRDFSIALAINLMSFIISWSLLVWFYGFQLSTCLFSNWFTWVFSGLFFVEKILKFHDKSLFLLEKNPAVPLTSQNLNHHLGFCPGATNAAVALLDDRVHEKG